MIEVANSGFRPGTPAFHSAPERAFAEGDRLLTAVDVTPIQGSGRVRAAAFKTGPPPISFPSRSTGQWRRWAIN